MQPDTLDTLMTAVLLAAEELAKVYPQVEGDSVEIWKKYLLQQALKKQESMSEQERQRYRLEHLV
jgi:spore coat polysaccharide biosynthesis protein SpsF (cytidylyltransferase family)